MKVSQFSISNLKRELTGPGIVLHTGPFRVHLRTSIDFVVRAIHLLYSDFPLSELEFADFHVRIDPPRFRRWFRPQVQFYSDEETSFHPLPQDNAFALMEWCLNGCITTNAHQYLIVHASNLEREGSGLVLAAPPGYGKSTLTAALSAGNWRLLSDELTLIQPKTGLTFGLARPIGLKNRSIDVIRKFVTDPVIGPVARDTAKGDVAHLKPPTKSVERVNEPALPRWVVFPKFEPGAVAALTPYKKAPALLHLADHAFNYGHHGVAGFECLAALIDRSECYQFTYSKLDEAVKIFDTLASQ